MTLVKICGLTRPEDIDAVNSLSPDMAGFVFYGPSRRCVTRDVARELGSGLDPSIVKVGVFVDENPLVIADLVGSGIIDAVQLHGVEDSAYIHFFTAFPAIHRSSPYLSSSPLYVQIFPAKTRMDSIIAQIQTENHSTIATAVIVSITGI